MGRLPPAPTGPSLSIAAIPPPVPLPCAGRLPMVPCGLRPPAAAPAAVTGGRPSACRSLGGGGLPRPPTSPLLAVAAPPPVLRVSLVRRATPPDGFALPPPRVAPHSKQDRRRAKLVAKPQHVQVQSDTLGAELLELVGPPPPPPPPRPRLPPPLPPPPRLAPCACCRARCICSMLCCCCLAKMPKRC